MPGLSYFYRMPFKAIHGKQDYYDLYIDYKGKQLHYITHMYYYRSGEESWYIKASNNRMLTFTWNVEKRELTQTDVYGKDPVPDYFMEIMKKEFEEK